ncbi:MAG: peptide chain release factor N(5)-glutamine methyltransferase [Terracidiphilus sp.]
MKSCALTGRARLSTGPHCDRAQWDAETLLLHVLDKNRPWLLGHGDDEVTDYNCARYMETLERRSLGEPIQYITGETEFYGLPFRVTRDVLIPRPETEHLVERAIALAGALQQPRIVDVGTGSSAIAVALSRHLPKAQVTAIDLSPKALAIAMENAARNGVGERIRFLKGDLLAPVAGEGFDLVVSNPPYVAESERGTLAVEVRDYEPAMALFAGKDGLDVYRRLIPAAHDALVPGGFLVMEIGCGQAKSVAALFADAGFDAVEFVPDLQGIPRVASARRAAAA